MRRSGEICGAYGGRISNHIKDYKIEYSDEGNSCTYHRVTWIMASVVERVKSSETSWIAVRGKDHICVVTLDVAGETPDLFRIFNYEQETLEAVVSVIPDTDETQAGGAIAAISEYNEMLAINFLRKILSDFRDLSYGDTVLIAIIAFRHLLSRNIMPNELKILVAGRDNLTTMSLPIDKTKTLLDVSHGVTKSESIDRWSLASAVSLLQDNGMGSLETSDTYVGRHYGNVNETGYHRRTHIFDDGQSVEIVKSSGTSWIAVQGQEALCLVNCGTALEKLEKPDLIKFFTNPFFDTKAVVSVALGSNDVQGGSGTGGQKTTLLHALHAWRRHGVGRPCHASAPPHAFTSMCVSIADDNEKSAVNFLVKKTSTCSNFTYKETIQTAIIAHRHLCPENLQADEIEIYVLRKVDQNFRVFSIRDIEALDDFNFEATFVNGNLGSSRWPDVGKQETGSQKTREKKRRTSYNRETQIWCGGWDSKLLYSFGFSWIAVQGKDSVCVVTLDEVGEMFLDCVIDHMIGNDVFGIKYQSSKKRSLMRPFAAVSVFVDFGDIDKERSHEASRAEMKTVEFLARKLKEISDLTYETIVQTAISGILCLTEKDLHAEEIKACVFRIGELPTEYDIIAVLPINEIEEHLRQEGKMKLPEEDSASSSKRRRL